MTTDSMGKKNRFLKIRAVVIMPMMASLAFSGLPMYVYCQAKMNCCRITLTRKQIKNLAIMTRVALGFARYRHRA